MQVKKGSFLHVHVYKYLNYFLFKDGEAQTQIIKCIFILLHIRAVVLLSGCVDVRLSWGEQRQINIKEALILL